MLKKLSSFVVPVGIVILFAGLALLAWLGIYNRYWADDWCYSADAVQLGTIGATLQYFGFEGTGYSPNRYSLTFLSTLTENTLGVFGTQLYGPITILLWLVGITWVLYNITRQTKISFWTILLASAILLYFNLYASPQRFQILYWRSGVLPYSTAVIFWLMMMGLVTRQLRHNSNWINYVLAPFAFLTAGLGEMSATLLFTSTSIVLFGVWWAKRNGKPWADSLLKPTFIAWFFLLLGMAALIVSPSNVRIAEMGVVRSSLADVPRKALSNSFAFIWLSLRTLPIPHAVFLISVFSLSVMTQQSVFPPLTFKRFWILLGVSTFLTVLLIIAMHTPAAYFYSTPPDPRGKSLARFTMLAGLGFMAWIGGAWTAGKFNSNLLSSAAIISFLLCLAYTARSMTFIYAELPGFIWRAEIWDQRAATILSEKEKGNLLIEVPAIDTADINTRDMFRSSGIGWRDYEYNCAARYYGVEGLKVKQE
jgi:hypothetical protein